MTDYLPVPPPWTIETLSDYIDELVGFITEYEDIAKFNSHHVFTRGLPVNWAPEYDLERWMAIISGDYAEDIPEKLSKFVKLSQRLPLVDTRTSFKGSTGTNRKGMTPKKGHEVDAMVAFVAEMTKTHGISTRNVLDVGSGLGYFSLELSKAGYNVVGVEGDPERAKKATATSGVKCFSRMINNHSDLEIIMEPCIALSLHACGNLSISMMQHFLSCDNVKLLINVGCCYNRLHTGIHSEFNFLITDDFPISQYYRERKIKLDHWFRHLAVQATSRWTVDTMAATIRKHYYRALLEILFARHGLTPMVGKLRDHVYLSGFKEYVRKVVHKLKLPETFIDEADVIGEYSDQKVISAVCLRGMCAGVVESLIIVDRWIAIKEQLTDGYVGLHRIFDATISPRGWAIVAVRNA